MGLGLGLLSPNQIESSFFPPSPLPAFFFSSPQREAEPRRAPPIPPPPPAIPSPASTCLLLWLLSLTCRRRTGCRRTAPSPHHPTTGSLCRRTTTRLGRLPGLDVRRPHTTARFYLLLLQAVVSAAAIRRGQRRRGLEASPRGHPGTTPCHLKARRRIKVRRAPRARPITRPRRVMPSPPSIPNWRRR